MDTKLFVLLPEMFLFPVSEIATATSCCGLGGLTFLREYLCTNWGVACLSFYCLFPLIIYFLHTFQYQFYQSV